MRFRWMEIRCLDSDEMVRQRQPEYILFDEWLHLDEIEIERGKEKDRPRVKFTVIDEMISVVDYKQVEDS